jgi:polar amino acid transport system substrate-binding protein
MDKRKQDMRLMRLSTWTILAVAALVALLLGPSPTASADQITFVSAHIPPFSIKDGKRAGFVRDIVSELAERIGVPFELQYAASPREAMKIAQSRPNTVIFPLARTKQREPHFLWVQKVSEVPILFGSAPGKPQIATVAQAKSVNAIGVRRGFAVKDLSDRGFENLVVVEIPEDNARALAAGRIEAWYAPEPEILYTWNSTDQMGLVVRGLTTRTIDSYIAASKPSPKITLSLWRAAFDAMQREGKVDELIDSYLGR